MRRIHWLPLLLCLALGCGGDGTKPVRGKLTVDGRPLAKAGIVFTPLGPGGRTAYAETGEDGSYTLKTFQPGDGALPGEYRVTIVWEEQPHPYLHHREGSAEQKALEKDYLQWKATHKATASPVPAEYGKPATTPLKVTVPIKDGIADFDIVPRK